MKKTICLLITVSLCSIIHAQEIPCNGFENWSTTGDKNPVGWSSLNWTAAFGAPYTCTPTTDAYAGSLAMKLESVIYGGDTVDGFAFTGRWPSPFAGPELGYAYSMRPSKLKGYYKFSSGSGDSCALGVFLTKWDPVLKKQDSIGVGVFYGKATDSFVLFEAPVTYYRSGFPDTATVILLASSSTTETIRGKPGNVLIADELSFEHPSGISEFIFSDRHVMVFPNPFCDRFRVTLPQTAGSVAVKIMDAYGRVVLKQVVYEGEIEIDLSSQADGVYLLECTIGSDREFMKLVKGN